MAILTSLTNSVGVTQDLDQESASAVHTLGDIYYDGRNKYVYSLADEALSQYSILTVDEDKLEAEDVATEAATKIYLGKAYGDQTIIVKAAWGLTIGAHKGWRGVVDDGVGVGQVFIVDDNDATHLYLKSPIVTALTVVGNSDITVYSPNELIAVPASEANHAVYGVNQIAVTDAYYFWCQTEGDAFVLCGADASSSYGLYLITGDDTKGTGAIAAATTGLEDAIIVGQIIAGSDTADKPVMVLLK